MTTADFSLDEFIKIAKGVKQYLNADTRLAANIGDFTLSNAMRLRESGITGVYHVNRLREGVDTAIKSDRESITALELTKIAAVANLIVRPSRAMNLHETEQMGLLAGTNQLYAECGANPRDNSSNTELNRGLSINRATELLRDSGWHRC
ncbi:MAG: hypothetical protein R3Y39_06460 [Rikenellaceae bacterium]